jgi:hypothetical protein
MRMTVNLVRSSPQIIATNANFDFSVVQTTTLPNATFSHGRNTKRDGNG